MNTKQLLKEALSLHKARRIVEAEAIYRRILDIDPDHVNAAYNLGVLHHETGNLKDAIRWYEKTTSIQPGHANAYTNLGAASHSLGDTEKAAACYEKALGADPNNPVTYHNLATLFQQQGMYRDAVICCRKAIDLRPGYASAYYHLGNALKACGDLQKAAGAYRNAISSRPDYPSALNNLGITLQDMGDLEGAIVYYRRAIGTKPDYADAYGNLGSAYEEEKEFSKAIECYDKALDLNPGNGDACARLVHLLQHRCDWKRLEILKDRLSEMTEASLRNGERPPETPFMSCSTFPEPKRNLSVCRSWSVFRKQNTGAGNGRFPAHPKHSRKKKITIGYFSNTFMNHPGTHLIQGLFARHDRRYFNVNCYSYGPDDGSEYRKRIEQDCDDFIDIFKMGILPAAEKIYHDEVDILVDLRGHTVNNRIGICSLRPAPVQISYLGFPCTTGADYIDYMIVDKVVAPPGHEEFYSEQLVYMPHCYQVNDNTQRIAETAWTREEMKLPATGTVFASFNSPYKIEPAGFDCWMRILRNVPESVLWLLKGQRELEENLTHAARDRGVDPCRIIFAEKMQKPDHLSRLRLADLVLDTHIYNGHVSTSDALWAGVPVVTLLGTHFASRVSASILNAVGLSELAVRTAAEYEQMAIRFGRDPELLSQVRRKLSENRDNAPLFDTERFARNLERAYETMWEIYLSGEKPKTFIVEEPDRG